MLKRLIVLVCRLHLIMLSTNLRCTADDFPVGQIGIVEEEEEVSVEVADLAHGARPQRQNVNFDYERSMITTIYGNHDEVQGLNQFRLNLHAEVARSQLTYNLDAEKCQKLLLAGNGDIKHLTDRVAEFRKCHFGNGNAIFEAGVFRLGLNELQKQSSRDHRFGPGSLYGKTLKKVVTQTGIKQDIERDAHYLKIMVILVTSNVGTETPLRDEQQQPLTEMLQSRIQNSPPVLFDEYEELIIRLLEMPARNYEDVLDDKQLAGLRSNLAVLRENLSIERSK